MIDFVRQSPRRLTQKISVTIPHRTLVNAVVVVHTRDKVLCDTTRTSLPFVKQEVNPPLALLNFPSTILIAQPYGGKLMSQT
jgi:hypothetical protein